MVGFDGLNRLSRTCHQMRSKSLYTIVKSKPFFCLLIFTFYLNFIIKLWYFLSFFIQWHSMNECHPALVGLDALNSEN